MSDSPHLGLGYLAPSQAQKHVTVNEAFRRLDALVQLGVLDRTLAAPPPAPAEGERHIVGPAASGAWAGRSNQIAAWLDGGWTFIAPKPGWLAYVAAEAALLVYLPGGWIGALGSLASLEGLSTVGVSATPDETNRLAVASHAVLFNHAGAGVQVKLNKAAAADTASLLFQQGYSGRAEFGLTGSDAFGLKVSPDGGSWTTALVVDPATGEVETPATPEIQIDKFTASGLWTKPAWARRVRVLIVGGGAGGGSGGLRGTGVAVAGGGGGSPGVTLDVEMPAVDLPATVAVTIGAGGAGGAAQSVVDGNGANGAAGGSTSFGAFLRTVLITASAGAGGGVTTAAGGIAPGTRFIPAHADVVGGTGTLTTGGAGGAGPGLDGSGAGGGGGLSVANAEAAGGASGIANSGSGYQAALAGGVAPGGAGVSGAPGALAALRLITGASGSGGASGNAVNGGAGGDGAAPGGAGGGGGASRNGRVSGKGGAGARGEAWIISMR